MNKKILIGCSILTAVLLIAGFFAPPVGQIDNSVLIGAGELSGLATLSLGFHAIDKGYAAKLSRGNHSIELNN